jgi:hypothetical protein
MSLQLSGLNTLAYKGVEASQPPQLLYMSRRPTPNDNKGVNVGTFWLYNPTNAEELWILLSVEGGTALWVQLYPSGAGGASQFPCDFGSANELLGVVNVFGDGNVITSGAGNTITLSLSGDFPKQFPTDSGTAVPVAGVLNINAGNATNVSGGSVKFTAPGATNLVRLETTDSNANTMIGNTSGNNTVSGTANTFVGSLISPAITSGSSNSCLGAGIAATLTTGQFNTFVGSPCFPDAVSSSFNIGIGAGAGLNCSAGTESSNIYIGNTGVATENNTIRIGMDGVGNGQQNAAYMAGIYGASIGATNGYVKIDSTGKLGSTASAPSDYTLISTQNPSGIYYVDFLNLTGSIYKIMWSGVQCINLNVGATINRFSALRIRCSNNNGASWLNTTLAGFEISLLPGYGSDELEGIPDVTKTGSIIKQMGSAEFQGLNNVLPDTFSFGGHFSGSGSTVTPFYNGYYLGRYSPSGLSGVNALRFEIDQARFPGVNFNSGTFSLYEITI